MKRFLGCVAVLALVGAGFGQSYSSPSPQIRAAAIRTIGAAKPDLKRLDELEKSLFDSDSAVVLESLRVWAAQGHDMMQLLSDDDRWEFDDVVSRAKRNAEQATHERIVAQLSKLATGQDPVLRREALRAICANANSARDLCYFAECGLNSGETFDYKVHAALNSIGKTEPAELRSLVNDSNPDVVFNAIDALTEEPWRDFSQYARLFVSSPNKYFCAIGIWIAEKSPTPTRLALIGPFINDPDKELRTAAEQFLRLTDREAYEVALNRDRWSGSMRACAIRQILEVRDEVLLPLVSDPEPLVRAAVFDQLIERPNELVRQCLQDPAPAVKAVALTQAQRRKFPNLELVIKAGLVSDDRAFRQAALEAADVLELGTVLTPEILRAVDLGVDAWPLRLNLDFDNPKFKYLIEECMSSPNPEVRRMLGMNLSEANPDRLELLIGLAHDPEASVAAIAMSRLSSMPDQKAFETLVDLTSCEVVAIRRGAVMALGETGRTSAKPVVEKFLNDEDRTVRNVAKRALAQLEGH